MAGKRVRPDMPLTTAQQLASLVRSARDIMRRDRGLSGDLDRLPQLTWVMFLKIIDDMERLQAETQAELDALQPSILDRAFKGEL